MYESVSAVLKKTLLDEKHPPQVYILSHTTCVSVYSESILLVHLPDKSSSAYKYIHIFSFFKLKF